MADKVAQAAPPFNIVNGVLVPSQILPEHVEKLKEFQLYPDDVWVVTYPKCGTTWAQQIVRLIRNKGVSDGVKITEAVPWLEAINMYPEVDVERLARPRAFKSHMPYDHFPCGLPSNTPCKYIYVARNPKDTVVSIYFHIKRLKEGPDIDFDTLWKQQIEGKVPFGDFFDHVLGWWQHRDDENVLFLKYEEMKKNLPLAVSQVASFIGADLSSDLITKIADMTSFDKMKQDNTTNYSQDKMFKPDAATKFMRKGTAGDWKNHLSPEQSAQMDALCAQKLKDTGLEFEFE